MASHLRTKHHTLQTQPSRTSHHRNQQHTQRPKQPNNKNNPIHSAKIVETNSELSSQTLSELTLDENSCTFKDHPNGLSLEGLEKERLMLKLVDEGWYFRLKEVKNTSYLCVRKSKEEHSLGSYTKEIKYITEKKQNQNQKNTKTKVTPLTVCVSSLTFLNATTKNLVCIQLT